MPDVQVNYADMQELINMLNGSSFQFSDAAYLISKMLTTVHEDGLDGKAGQQLLKSLHDLQTKLASACTKFEKLAKAVQMAAEEMRERDSAAKF